MLFFMRYNLGLMPEVKFKHPHWVVRLIHCMVVLNGLEHFGHKTITGLTVVPGLTSKNSITGNFIPLYPTKYSVLFNFELAAHVLLQHILPGFCILHTESLK